jgi:hypothetical protein
MSRDSNKIFQQESPNDTQAVSNQVLTTKTLDWEVPVETVPLPSKGVIYHPDSFFYNKETIDIKAMTAKEEDILLSQAYIKKGTMIDELIKSCIGNINADPTELTAGDKNALLVAIRITGYGPEYPVTIQCEKCGHVNNKQIDLSNLTIRRLGAQPVKIGQNLFEFNLPVSKKRVLFKILNGKDEIKRNEEIFEISKKLGADAVGSVTIHMIHSIVAIDDVTDKNQVSKFINSMPARDSRALRKYMNEIQPGINMEADFTCESCNHATMVTIPWTSKLLYPD